MKRLALFAHYDARQEVKRFITFFLRRLRQDCDRIFFVSTAKLPEREIDKVRPYCAATLLEDDVGFDFGMWKHALDGIDVDEWDEIVLTNSSVFGPLAPLGPIFESMSARDCDIWGMSDNVEIAWHLQSYFMVFKKRAIQSQQFRDFWNGVLLYRDEDQVIRSYEVGLSRLFLDHGFELHAYAPLDSLPVPISLPPLTLLPEFDLWSRILTRRANPTCAYPVALIRAGMPFVKAELLRDNPLQAHLDPVWREMRRAGFDMSLVEFDRPVLAGHGRRARRRRAVSSR